MTSCHNDLFCFAAQEYFPREVGIRRAARQSRGFRARAARGLRQRHAPHPAPRHRQWVFLSFHVTVQIQTVQQCAVRQRSSGTLCSSSRRVVRVCLKDMRAFLSTQLLQMTRIAFCRAFHGELLVHKWGGDDHLRVSRAARGKPLHKQGRLFRIVHSHFFSPSHAACCPNLKSAFKMLTFLPNRK